MNSTIQSFGDTSGAYSAARIQSARDATTETLAKNSKHIAQIDKASVEFETSFLTEMLKPMFEEVNKGDDMFGGGKGEEVFGGMMVDEYAKSLANHGGLGIAKTVRAEMLRLQEVQDHGNR